MSSKWSDENSNREMLRDCFDAKNLSSSFNNFDMTPKAGEQSLHTLEGQKQTSPVKQMFIPQSRNIKMRIKHVSSTDTGNSAKQGHSKQIKSEPKIRKDVKAKVEQIYQKNLNSNKRQWNDNLK